MMIDIFNAMACVKGIFEQLFDIRKRDDIQRKEKRLAASAVGCRTTGILSGC